MDKLLIVEDDPSLNEGLVFDLELDNYQVDSAFNLEDAERKIKSNHYDLIVLDGNLPDGSGFSLCKSIKEKSDTPVIFLTGKDQEQDTIRGFELGAEDYITKPFSMPVFRKRVSAVLKRTKPTDFTYKDEYLTIHFDTFTCEKEGESLILTPNEFKLLKLLLLHKGQVVTRQLILERLWDNEENFVDEHTLTVTMNRLRGKIETKEHTYIKTIYGTGYQWIGNE